MTLSRRKESKWQRRLLLLLQLTHPSQQSRRTGLVFRSSTTAAANDPLRRLWPQCNLRAHRRRVLRNGRPAGTVDEALRHRVLVEESGLLHEPLALLQQRPWRMPSVATGALLANRTMKALGVSGDGDTASIGIGQFVHMMRRNVPIIYIIEDNGVYGLTKGQFFPRPPTSVPN